VEVLNSRYVDWGFKDPRTCLTYPAWAQELDQHRLIIIFRSYAEVAMHYGLVGAKLFRLVRLMKVLKAWTTYNQQILDHLEAAKVPSIVMSYEDFMRAPGEFDRLCTFVGRPLSDIRNPALYRSRAAGVGTFTAVELLGRVLMSGQPAHVLSRLRQKKTANGLGVL
jgi:hypothetical protein